MNISKPDNGSAGGGQGNYKKKFRGGTKQIGKPVAGVMDKIKAAAARRPRGKGQATRRGPPVGRLPRIVARHPSLGASAQALVSLVFACPRRGDNTGLAGGVPRVARELGGNVGHWYHVVKVCIRWGVVRLDKRPGELAARMVATAARPCDSWPPCAAGCRREDCLACQLRGKPSAPSWNRGGFWEPRLAILRDRRFSLNVRMVWALLAYLAGIGPTGRAFLGRRCIKDWTGFSEHTIQRALAVLEASGTVERVERMPRRGWQRRVQDGDGGWVQGTAQAGPPGGAGAGEIHGAGSRAGAPVKSRQCTSGVARVHHTTQTPNSAALTSTTPTAKNAVGPDDKNRPPCVMFPKASGTDEGQSRSPASGGAGPERRSDMLKRFEATNKLDAAAAREIGQASPTAAKAHYLQAAAEKADTPAAMAWVLSLANVSAGQRQRVVADYGIEKVRAAVLLAADNIGGNGGIRKLGGWIVAALRGGWAAQAARADGSPSAPDAGDVAGELLAAVECVIWLAGRPAMESRGRGKEWAAVWATIKRPSDDMLAAACELAAPIVRAMLA